MTLQKEPHLNWLAGRSIKAIEKLESSWLFVLDDGSTISTEEHWRLLSAKGLLVGSECDDRVRCQQGPVSAAEWAKRAINDAKIQEFGPRPPTGDLLLSFDNGMVLEFLVLSPEREAWAVRHTNGAETVVCTGGSGIGVYG